MILNGDSKLLDTMVYQLYISIEEQDFFNQMPIQGWMTGQK